MKSLPEKIQKELNNWYGQTVKPAHFWERDGAYLVVVIKDRDSGLGMDCVRLWESPEASFMGGKVLISVDKKIDIDSRVINEYEGEE